MKTDKKAVKNRITRSGTLITRKLEPTDAYMSAIADKVVQKLVASKVVPQQYACKVREVSCDLEVNHSIVQSSDLGPSRADS